MTLTVYHRYILDCLREIPYIQRENLRWLTKLQFGTDLHQFNRDLMLLYHLNRLTLHGNNGSYVSLPCAKINRPLLIAADIMREVCGDSLPTFLRGTPPCVLSFYLQDKRGYLDFKVVPVPPGSEQLVLEQLRRAYPSFKCTWLFLPESHEQIEKLHTENPACFVFRNKAGGYDFLRKT